MIKIVRTLFIILSITVIDNTYAQDLTSDKDISNTLTISSWKALSNGNYELAIKQADLCIEKFEGNAIDMHSSLNDFPDEKNIKSYWSLNDIATCYFIKGRAYFMQDKIEEAKNSFNMIIENFSFSQCWNPQGWYWNISEAANDQIMLMNTNISFGDYTSQTLTAKAWESFNTGEYDLSLVYCRKCIQLYKESAKKMQSQLKQYAKTNKSFDYWALNDVGTCYFIMGEAYRFKREFKKSLKAYQRLIDNFNSAQCWSPNGSFFWSPAKQAETVAISIKEYLRQAKPGIKQ
ncbi:MAG: tetratricopeptide repeat protein [Candidatus Aureabacteria bacterium]|nr:tetratricopeptide repeat protein [Candidatus Auribacterota bacterium]